LANEDLVITALNLGEKTGSPAKLAAKSHLMPPSAKIPWLSAYQPYPNRRQMHFHRFVSIQCGIIWRFAENNIILFTNNLQTHETLSA